MSITIKQLPETERPYEKMELYGENALSNAELLAIILKTGTKEESSVVIAQKLLSLYPESENNLDFLKEMSIEEFMHIKGIGKVKAIQLKAIGELTKRIARPITTNQVQINSPKEVAELLINEMRYDKREIVKVILLNAKNKVIKIEDVCFGGTNSAILKPKDVLQEAIKLGVPKIILVHNHPSGDPTPSKSDFAFTERLLQASETMGIELLDHIVIGENRFESIFYLKSKNN